jgi:hypothetical protein
MKLEMAKPGKDGMEKTLEECMETFTMVLKNKDITKNTFLRNAGFLQSKSKSKSFSAQVLEEQLQIERAAADVLRNQVDMLRSRSEACDALLEEANQVRYNLSKTNKMP